MLFSAALRRVLLTLSSTVLLVWVVTAPFHHLAAQPKKKLTAKMLQLQGISVSKVEALSSPFKEASITLAPTGRFMYFMTERGGQPWSQFDDKLSTNDRDIWYAERKDGVWQRPTPLPETINSAFGEDEPNITPDGQNVFFQSFRNGWEGLGGPYFTAELHGKKWENLTGLGGTITSFFVSQSRDNNGSVASDGSSMSPAGNLFIFTCGKDLNPKTQHDIYYAKRFIDGSFSQVEKLEISTPKNERSIFIGVDGKTLYFSSNGYGGLGGLDIFKATLNDDGTVGALYNLGEPFNTKGDDYGFVMSADGKEAYFVRDGDVYLADLAAVESRELKPAPIVIISGKVRSKATGSPLESSIDISEVPATGMEDAVPSSQMYSLSARSNNVTGEYTAVLKPNKKYVLSASASKHKGVNKEFVLNAENTQGGIFTLDIELDAVAPRPPKTKIVTTATVAGKSTGTGIAPKIGTIYFNSDDFSIEEKFLDELDKAWEFLKANPSYQAELSGFADDRGSYEYNLRLSQRRVNAVVDYLWSLGCERKRLALKFFGEEEPVANNLTPDGRSRNRRADITFFRKAEDAPPPAPKAVPPAKATSSTPAKGTAAQPQPTSPTPTASKPSAVPTTSQRSTQQIPVSQTPSSQPLSKPLPSVSSATTTLSKDTLKTALPVAKPKATVPSTPQSPKKQ
jgi:outer membrane protein OmpA-like peptidoglycan-associated protein